MVAFYRCTLVQRLLLGMVAGWVASLLAVSVNAQTTVPDLFTYEQWLREARIAAQRGDRLGLEQVATRLIETSAVQMSDAATVPVNNQWLREALAATEPDLESIDQQLGALIEALAQPDPAAPADARQRLEEILNRPPFAETGSSAENGLVARFFDWLGRVLVRLFNPISVGPTTGSAITWFFAVVGGVLVIGVLVYLLRGMLFSLTPEAQDATAEEDPEANLTANTALHQASTLAQEGDYRTAVRYLYLSSLLWLDEHGMLRYDRALTNREYLERLRDNAELRARLTPIIDTFDQVWYGHLPLDDESFAAYRQQVDGLRRIRG